MGVDKDLVGACLGSDLVEGSFGNFLTGKLFLARSDFEGTEFSVGLSGEDPVCSGLPNEDCVLDAVGKAIDAPDCFEADEVVVAFEDAEDALVGERGDSRLGSVGGETVQTGEGVGVLGLVHATLELEGQQLQAGRRLVADQEGVRGEVVGAGSGSSASLDGVGQQCGSRVAHLTLCV